MRGSSIVWKALERARRSNLAAAGEAPPVAGSQAVTRRALLQGFAALGAAMAMPRPSQAANVRKVAIVGGGVAGLSALHHLTEAGVDAHVYEARARLGGRMFTQRPANGVAFEVGGQLVNSDHLDMRALCGRFGIRLIDRKQTPHHTLILADGRVLTEAELAEGLRGIAAQIGADADRLDKSFARVAADLDSLSVRQYLDRHAALMPVPWARRLLEATCRTEFGVEPGEASAIELVYNLPTVNGERVEVLGASDERFVMENGSGALIDAMASHYGGRISTGQRLLRIERHGAGVRLAFLDGSSAEADMAIVTVPAPIMRQIDYELPLPAAWRAFIAEASLGRNAKVQAAASNACWNAPMGTGGEVWQTGGEGYALGWEGSVHSAGGASPVWTWYLGGDQVDDAVPPSAQAHRFARSTEPAIPGLVDATATGPYRRTSWHRDPLTLGAYANYGPGQMTRFGRLMWIEAEDPAERQVARAGRIVFAGEHLSDAFPGYMNGGAQTGRLAADAVIGKHSVAQAA